MTSKLIADRRLDSTEDKADRVADVIRKCKAVDMPDKIAMDELEAAIEYLRGITPDVFLSMHGVGYVKAWKYGSKFWLECQRADGEWYHGVFFDPAPILDVCKRYFNALQTGEDLLGVM